MLSLSQWVKTLRACAVSEDNIKIWAPILQAEITSTTFKQGHIELRDFLAQVLHESALLKATKENLNYRKADTILKTWPKRFKTVDDAGPYVANPEALANYVYAGRNGNTEPTDGWKYRGRGLIQITGRSNYTLLAGKLGINLVATPELLEAPDLALRASICWWNTNVPQSAVGDTKKVTRVVNGGQHGLADRHRLAKIIHKEIIHV
jgi:putative chitinase